MAAKARASLSKKDMRDPPSRLCCTRSEQPRLFHTSASTLGLFQVHIFGSWSFPEQSPDFCRIIAYATTFVCTTDTNGTRPLADATTIAAFAETACGASIRRLEIGRAHV